MNMYGNEKISEKKSFAFLFSVAKGILHVFMACLMLFLITNAFHFHQRHPDGFHLGPEVVTDEEGKKKIEMHSVTEKDKKDFADAVFFGIFGYDSSDDPDSGNEAPDDMFSVIMEAPEGSVGSELNRFFQEELRGIVSIVDFSEWDFPPGSKDKDAGKKKDNKKPKKGKKD